MQPGDPAYWMLYDDVTSTPTVRRDGCYICMDPEFAQMGLPLCRPCPPCSKESGSMSGHVAADDTTCDVCGADEQELFFEAEERGACLYCESGICRRSDHRSNPADEATS
jgi:hypothetical protein